ncbi:hypothetical protein V1511DRAFT_492093 [Dipodascopsis uninucleata]
MSFYSPSQHPLLVRDVNGSGGNSSSRTSESLNNVERNFSNSSVVSSSMTSVRRQRGPAYALSLSTLLSQSDSAISTTESEVSAGNILQDEEWVLFSAGGSSSLIQEEEVNEDEDKNEDQDEDNDNPNDVYDMSILAIGDRDNEGYAIATPGRRPEHGFAFPEHDGHGSFVATPTQHAITALPSYSSAETTARINAWRLDHSEQLFRELQRLQSRSLASHNRRSDSISSWGIPSEEHIDESNSNMYHNDANRNELDDGDLDKYSDVDSENFLVMRPARGVMSSVARQSKATDESTRWGLFNSAPNMADAVNRREQVNDDNSQSLQSSGGFWQRLTRRVIHDIIGINDEVLDVLFGERSQGDSALHTLSAEDGGVAKTTLGPELMKLLYPPAVKDFSQAEIVSERASSVISSSCSSYPQLWEEKLIARIGRELGLRYCNDYGSIEICHGLFV